MAANTHISWCHHTCNIHWGCEELPGHPACEHCYARVFATRVGKADAWEGVRYAVPGVWKAFETYQREAAKAGEIRRVFVGSMMDIGEKALPAVNWKTKEPLRITTGDLRDRYFREVVPATPNLLHLMLTKRPGNIPKQVPAEWLANWPANVMTGTSVSDQKTADVLVPQLLRVPGRRFLSIEPLIGPVETYYWYTTHNWHNWLTGETGLGRTTDNFSSHEQTGQKVDWVIVGGESGHHARPMYPGWPRMLLRQCQNADVPFHFKQWGEWIPCDQGDCDEHAGLGIHLRHDGEVFEDDGPTTMCCSNCHSIDMTRIGTKAAGRELDGREWNEAPTLAGGQHVR